MQNGGSEDAQKRGRPKRLTGSELNLAQRLYFEEGFSMRDVADALSVSHMTVWRAISEGQT